MLERIDHADHVIDELTYQIEVARTRNTLTRSTGDWGMMR